jgi:ribonuclease VapC
MMVDTSAVVAILRNEPEARQLVGLLENAKRPCIVAPTVLEICMVMLNKKQPEGLGKIWQTMRELGLTVIPFTSDMAEHATQAFLRYGKGQGHPAQLNFGDCMSYAASKVEAMPLLFKGDDFRLTDVKCAI